MSKLFYRYRPIIPRKTKPFNSEEELEQHKRERTEEFKKQLESYFHFSYPREFNDPFDCHIFCRYYGNKEDWEQYFLKHPDESLKDAVERLNYDPDEIDKLLFYVNNFYLAQFVVCCFSETMDNDLMWSHYAKEHKGICLGYESSESNGEYYLEMEDQVDYGQNHHRALLRNVNYKNGEPLILNPVKNDIYSYEDFYLMKRGVWDYENEYRILIKSGLFKEANNITPKQNYKFKKEILSEVIFGINTSWEDMKEIIGIVTDEYIRNGVNVEFLKAKKRKFSYGIEFEPVDQSNPLRYYYGMENHS